MTVEELAEGLWYWTAPHPEWVPEENWPEDVPCVYYESPDAVVLIDPVAPRGEEEKFWSALDRDVERLGRPVRILLTAPWHVRGSADFVERYGAEVWAAPDADGLATTDVLPAGVDALVPPTSPAKQALFLIREHGLLVAGDIFSATGSRFHVFFDEDDESTFLAWLPSLLDHEFERVLIAHGKSVLYTRDDVAAAI
jgi:hypothetical protein